MSSLWLAITLAALSWQFVVPVFATPSVPTWSALVLSAVALSVWALRRARVDAPRAHLYALAAASAVATILLPFPYSTGPALLLIGVLLVLLIPRGQPAGAGVAFTGTVMSLQALAHTVYFALAPRIHETPILGRLAAVILQLIGANARLAPEGILLHNGSSTAVFALNTEQFAAYFWLLLLVGAIPVLLASRARVRTWVAVLAVAWVYSEVRFAVLVLMVSTSSRPDAFWSGPLAIITLLPLAFVLATVTRLELRAEFSVRELPGPQLRQWVATGLAFLGVVALVGSAGLADPGTMKPGRVIMDEGHGDWESSTEAFDTEWYGEKSGYNYYNLYEYLDLHFTMSRNVEPISGEVLADCDVLILKTPTTPFTTEETEAIVRFVADGGGLWLIGDHTNVFGTSTNLNPLAEKFGLHFTHTATYELTRGSLSEYRAPRLLPHPIVQHLPGTFLFATSSTIDAPLGADAAITGYGLKALQADYSQENFFPEGDPTSDLEFGLFLQGAATRYGQGRVAAFADSTVFSNFWMFMPGKPELALSYVDWLNRENSLDWARFALAGLGVVLLSVAIWVLRPRRAGWGSAVLALGVGLLIGVPVGAYSFSALNRADYPLPTARTEYTRIAFEQQFSRFAVPSTLAGFEAPAEESFHTFYVWTQRLGYVPSVDPTLRGALARADVLVLLNPDTPPDAADRRDIEEFVRGGGRLLVLHDAGHDTTTANAFLEPFGLRFDGERVGAASYRPKDGALVTFSADATRVEGGRQLLTTAEGDTVCAYEPAGEGVVVAFGDSGTFSGLTMATTNVVPDSRQRSVSELEYALMRFVAEDRDFDF